MVRSSLVNQICRSVSVAVAAALIFLSGCARPKRFYDLTVVSAPRPAALLSAQNFPDDMEQTTLESSIIDAYQGGVRLGSKFYKLFNLGVDPGPPLGSYNVSVRPEPAATAKSVFFEAGASAQAELIIDIRII